jgi:predicted DNA-binding transcriptional regulator AlpA
MTPPTNPTAAGADPVGAVEIGQRLGVKTTTVYTWQQRTRLNFPEPRWTISGRPAWDWTDIADWAANRAPVEDGEDAE